MTLGTIGLTVAYVVVALLLLSVNLYSRWPWWVKLGTIAVTSLFYVVTYVSYPTLLGWPTDAQLPERFRLLAVHVQEPSKVTGAEGKIFLWATDMSQPSDAEPRAYRVPYTGPLHQRVVEAGNKLRKGLPQLGETEEEEARSIPPDAIEDSTRYGQKSVRIEFFDLPDPLFPDK